MDKQQKTSEHVQNIKFSLDTQLNFMFCTCSPFFVYQLEVSLHFWRSWSTVRQSGAAVELADIILYLNLGLHTTGQVIFHRPL